MQVYGYEDDFLAELMLPEGSHRREEDKSFALLNRDMFQNRAEHINVEQSVSLDKPFSVQLYNLSNVVWVNWCATKIQVRPLGLAQVSPTLHAQMCLYLHAIYPRSDPRGNHFHRRRT